MDFYLTTFLAVWGAILSSMAIGWNIYRDFSKRRRLNVYVMIGNEVTSGIGITAKDVLFFFITNIGGQPIMVTKVGGIFRQRGLWNKTIVFFKRTGKGGFIVTAANIPKMLTPGDYVSEKCVDLNFLEKDIWYLFAMDSFGNTWKAKRKDLKEVRRSYAEIKRR